MFDTIALDSATWDLALTPQGDLGVFSGSFAIGQDVASACRTYLGEVWYDTTAGVPYFQGVLGEPLNSPLVAGYFNAAALSVPNTVQAQTTFDGLTPARTLVGTVEVIDTAGQALNATF